MLDANNILQANFDLVKRHLNVTWNDEDTDKKIIDIICDAEQTLNYKLGAEIDYFKPSAERRLFLDYCSYLFNDCQNEFDSAYMNDIYQIRHKYEIMENKNEQQ